MSFKGFKRIATACRLVSAVMSHPWAGNRTIGAHRQRQKNSKRCHSGIPDVFHAATCPNCCNIDKSHVPKIELLQHGDLKRKTQPASMALAFILIVALGIAFVSMRPTVLREAADPFFQPLGVDEIEAGLSRLQHESLPMVSLAPAHEQPYGNDSRLGGPIWAPKQDAGWPHDKAGHALLHVAQINFTEFEPPEGFPDAGLLQIFVRHNGTGLPFLPENSAEHADTDDGALHIRWYEKPELGVILPVPESLVSLKRGMMVSHQARTVGVALRPIRQTVPANPFAWPFVDDVYLNLTRRRPANDRAARMQNGLGAHFDRILNSYGGHWIGGYPSFTGEDVRKTSATLRGFDRVLLHLGFDKHVCIGNAGTLNILISAHDLVNRRFDRAYYSSEA